MKKSILSLLLLIGSFDLFAQVYCTPLSIPCSGDYISNVTFSGINRTSICDSPSTGFGYYPNYVAVVTPGQTLPISLSPGTPFAEAFIVWIDFNMDFTFSTNEIVLSSPNISYVTVTGAITIPGTAPSGVTRMRVRCADQINTLINNPCQNINFGETEDYLVSIDGMPTSRFSLKDQQEVMTFPNPVSNTLYIKSSTEKNLVGSQADILNIYGQKLISEKIQSNHCIELNHLPDGLYVLIVDGTYQRFMVKHDN